MTSPVIFLISAMLVNAVPGRCQPHMEFEAATIKPSQFGSRSDFNFPLGGDAYVSTGGLFAATNFSLASYIFFAYKIDGNQAQSLVPQFPRWVMEDHFDIQARAVID